MRYLFRGWTFWFSASVSLALPLAFSARQEARPPWWDIRISVEARGEYSFGTREIEREVRCTGSYKLAFVWTGSIERDDADYLLIHRSCDLVRWEIEERTKEGDSLKILTETDIPEKPELRVNYILKEGGSLFFDFIVRGFEVPKSFPSRTFYLSLPASEENDDQAGGINYDEFVGRGSNRIAVEEKSILAGPVERTFDWAWSRVERFPGPSGPAVQGSTHGARVTVSISPAPQIKRRGAPGALSSK
jgi:hypothetical protein